MNKFSRYYFISSIIVIAFSVTLVRLFQTTMFPDKRLNLNQEASDIRGNIYDRKGRILASASTTKSLFARPKQLAPELREYLKTYFLSTGYFSEQEVENFDKLDRNFVYIKRDMTPSIVKPVKELIALLKQEKYIKSDQLELISEDSRFYPYPCLRPIIGILGRDKSGLFGLEYTIDNYLRKGIGAQTTLDAEISKIAYEELQQAVKNSEADGGSIAAISISNREIIALVQVGSNSAPLSVSHIYEPGSVMKLFTAAFAMEQGLASTTSPTFNDASPYKIGDYTFSKPLLGYINLRTMLKKSANVSFARLAEEFGSSDYYLWLTELGFGQKPNLPLTQIERGILHPPSKWSSLSKPMMAIGQEIGVTTIQLAIAASMIGAGGIYLPPILLTSLQDSNAQELLNMPRTPKQLFHPQKAKELLYALETVVQPGGTASQAAVEGIRIAGKTGTGMIAGEKGYSTGKNNTVFIGFLPIEQPSLVVVVAIHNPKGSSRSGGGIAAPLFAKIIRRIILLEQYQ